MSAKNVKGLIELQRCCPVVEIDDGQPEDESSYVFLVPLKASSLEIVSSGAFSRANASALLGIVSMMDAVVGAKSAGCPT